ncbi:MAG TPA: hypothetical protein VGE38_16710 [Nocardioides sp.]
MTKRSSSGSARDIIGSSRARDPNVRARAQRRIGLARSAVSP